MNLDTELLKIAQKYRDTCTIYFDYDKGILLWKGFFKKYRTTFTRSETHQQLKLRYGNINMKITYIRIPNKPGIFKDSKLYKLPSFVSLNGNYFKIFDVLLLLNEVEREYLEEAIEKKLDNNTSIDFDKINQNTGNLLKSILLGYSLFTKFITFLNKNYKEFYEIIMNFNINNTINKEDIKQFLFDSDELDTVEALTTALKKAIKEEDYERASELKKQIEKLKNQT